jgi:hypothetical protein
METGISRSSLTIFTERYCPNCREQFRPNRAWQRYCSAPCRNRAWRRGLGYLASKDGAAQRSPQQQNDDQHNDYPENADHSGG